MATAWGLDLNARCQTGPSAGPGTGPSSSAGPGAHPQRLARRHPGKPGGRGQAGTRSPATARLPACHRGPRGVPVSPGCPPPSFFYFFWGGGGRVAAAEREGKLRQGPAPPPQNTGSASRCCAKGWRCGGTPKLGLGPAEPLRSEHEGVPGGSSPPQKAAPPPPRLSAGASGTRSCWRRWRGATWAGWGPWRPAEPPGPPSSTPPGNPRTYGPPPKTPQSLGGGTEGMGRGSGWQPPFARPPLQPPPGRRRGADRVPDAAAGPRGPPRCAKQ